MPSFRRTPESLAWSALPLFALATAASAHPVTYTIDPDHPYPSFAADHMGLSTWRGKFDHSTGTITLDRAKQTGTVHIVTRVDSINFGNPPLTQMVLRDAIPAPLCKTQCAFFDAAKYPTATYEGRLADFVDDAPTHVVGKLTLHDVTRPLDLKIERFQCIPDMVLKPRECCGAEASTTSDRADFGINAGKSFDLDMKVSMQIEVEAVRDK